MPNPKKSYKSRSVGPMTFAEKPINRKPLNRHCRKLLDNPDPSRTYSLQFLEEQLKNGKLPGRVKRYFRKKLLDELSLMEYRPSEMVYKLMHRDADLVRKYSLNREEFALELLLRLADSLGLAADRTSETARVNKSDFNLGCKYLLEKAGHPVDQGSLFCCQLVSRFDDSIGSEPWSPFLSAMKIEMGDMERLFPAYTESILSGQTTASDRRPLKLYPSDDPLDASFALCDNLWLNLKGLYMEDCH